MGGGVSLTRRLCSPKAVREASKYSKALSHNAGGRSEANCRLSHMFQTSNITSYRGDSHDSMLLNVWTGAPKWKQVFCPSHFLNFSSSSRKLALHWPKTACLFATTPPSGTYEPQCFQAQHGLTHATMKHLQSPTRAQENISTESSLAPIIAESSQR